MTPDTDFKVALYFEIKYNTSKSVQDRAIVTLNIIRKSYSIYQMSNDVISDYPE